MKVTENLISPGKSDELATSANSLDDFEAILRCYGLDYTSNEYQLQVGEIKKTQGWILHLSIVLSQIVNLFQVVIPFLLEEQVPFKIPASLTVCDDILSGNLGIKQMGKIISIYAENDERAVRLAEQLIQITRHLKGPLIPTDSSLGGIVYTRYGSFAPVIQPDSYGNKEKYIYDAHGNLIKDPYDIPFNLPYGIAWPFKKLAEISGPPAFKYSYRLRPLSILKLDPKGNVYKGIYLLNLLNIKKCVIKQGFKNMNSDLAGRDIRDRLIWQRELHQNIYKHIPVPKIYNFLEQEGVTYLIMEYVKGSSLYETLINNNPTSKSWLEFKPGEARKVFKYIIEITQIIGRLHQHGYVHRDIVPVNFLIDNHDRVRLIDLELSYSLNHNMPNPPFTWGTPGFMSPEQRIANRPTVKEDIYALGACLIGIFTGLTPARFNMENMQILPNQLFFFIRNTEIVAMITNCLDHDPAARPTIKQILNKLGIYQKQILSSKDPVQLLKDARPNLTQLRLAISNAINGLTREPVPIKDDLWYSSKRDVATSTTLKSKQYTTYPYLEEGIGGPMYMLSRLQKAGINIDSCKKAYFAGWEYLKHRLLNSNLELAPGLYDGAYGIALVIVEGIKSNLLTDSEFTRNMLEKCLSTSSKELNISTGLAGQGISLLQCQSFVQKQVLHTLLNTIKNGLLKSQNSDGSWKPFGNKNDFDLNLSFGYGIPGIVWFLLEYGKIYNDNAAIAAAEKSLDWIANNRQLRKRIATWAMFKKEVKGPILAMLKGYQILNNRQYKILAEEALSNYPLTLVKPDFTQKRGIAGIGELYLEAYEVLKEEKWLTRADWVTNVLLTTFLKSDETSGHWVLEENSPPTADFTIGISGIIHFLSRRLASSDIGYPFLK